MERRVTEERVTKSILRWLEANGWEIVSFDFPQSGTGRVLHSNDRLGSKNKDSMIPDIVAVREQKVVIFENKDKLDVSDFEKLNKMKCENNFSDSINQMLQSFTFTTVYYGVGLPITAKNKTSVTSNTSMVDFVIDSDGTSVEVFFQSDNIFNHN